MRVKWVRRGGEPEFSNAKKQYSDLADGASLPSWPQVFRITPNSNEQQQQQQQQPPQEASITVCHIGGYASLNAYLSDPTNLRSCTTKQVTNVVV
jgi:hypothetical protein